MSENRADSTEVLQDLAKQALKKIEPPLPIQEDELRFWEAITKARASWTEIDLIHAVNLARTLCSIEKETFLLHIEGSVIENNRGTPVMNPRHTVLEQLSRRAVVISGKLHIHALATQGEAKNVKKKNAKKQSIIEAIEDDEDSLIARPN